MKLIFIAIIILFLDINSFAQKTNNLIRTSIYTSYRVKDEKVLNSNNSSIKNCNIFEGKIKNIYTKKGLIKKSISYDSLNNVCFKYKTKKNKNYKTEWNKNYKETIKTKSDTNGIVLKETHKRNLRKIKTDSIKKKIDSILFIISYYKSNKDENLTRIEGYNSDSSIYYIETHTYDSLGNDIKYERTANNNIEKVYLYTYTFDKKGNWIEKMKNYNGYCIEYTKREINYYK